MQRPEAVPPEHEDRSRADFPTGSAAQQASPANVDHDAGVRRAPPKISVGSLVGWGIVTMLAALLLFVGFCAVPGLKSSKEDDDGRPRGGADVGKPQSR
jgi:hypothetical protein